MKQKILSALFLISVLFATSCDWDDYDDDYTEDWEPHHQNFVSTVRVAVGDVYRVTNGEYFYDYVPDYKVYCYTAEDVDHYGIYDRGRYFATACTDEQGYAVFQFTDHEISEYHSFVFVVYCDDSHATKLEIDLRPDEFADLVMFASGEAPLVPVFRNNNARYNLVSVLGSQTYLYLDGLGDKECVTFSLPENTVYWYYTFTSFDYTDFVYDFSLYGALDHFFSPRYGIDANVANRIEPPYSDCMKCPRVYLLDEENNSNFGHNRDFNYISYFKDVYSYVVEESEVVRGRLSLAFENTSAFTTKVFVQVVAVVED